ncbi:MAG TPA: hypothetical protein VGQ19_21090 [Burkholderiales bacterium]|jgi:hypothetical protein|nr:hypothetical protein [Burkholderiales bacterium]
MSDGAGLIEHRDYVLGATTNAMSMEYAKKITRLEKSIPILKNQDGGYAHDLRDCLEMYREIAAVIAKYKAMKRTAP